MKSVEQFPVREWRLQRQDRDRRAGDGADHDCEQNGEINLTFNTACHVLHGLDVKTPAGALAVVLVMSGASCASSLAGPTPSQDSEIVLAPGASARLTDTNLIVYFEEVVEDSRCPTGVSCVWEGDAAVRIRIDNPKVSLSRYTLHTNSQFVREAEQDGVLLRLVDVAPHPLADRKTQPDDYRVTLSIKRK